MTTLTYVVGDERHVVDAPGSGDLTVLVTPDVWKLLQSGDLDAVVAYMQGKVKITGDMAALFDLLPTIPVR